MFRSASLLRMPNVMAPQNPTYMYLKTGTELRTVSMVVDARD